MEGKGGLDNAAGQPDDPSIFACEASIPRHGVVDTAGSCRSADQDGSDRRIALAQRTRPPEDEALYRTGSHDCNLMHVFELPLRIGLVRLCTPKLNLPLFELDDNLFTGERCGCAIDLPSCSASIMAIPDHRMMMPTVGLRDGYIDYVHHRYVRCWVDMRGFFESYESRCLSAKFRSDIRRQTKRFLQHTGEDVLDVRYYRTPAEISEFSALAEQISEKTFQEQKAGCGWPRDKGSEQHRILLAEEGGCFGSIMFGNQEPVSYQYMTSKNKRFIGKYLGFDPKYQKYSPGKIHMSSCIEHLFDDPSCDIYDFAGGNFRYMIQFCSDSASCADMLRLSFRPRYLLLVGAHLTLTTITKISTIFFDALGLRERLRKKLRGR